MTDGDCIPLEDLPGTTQLFRDVVSGAGSAHEFYAGPAASAQIAPETRAEIGTLLETQNLAWQAGPHTRNNIARLRGGAQAIVTGQQVSLFGGPLYSFLKAATAVAHARKATAQGIETVPIFWMATEDHDFAEVSSATLLEEDTPRVVRLSSAPRLPVEVGGLVPDAGIVDAVAQAEKVLRRAAQPDFAIAALQDAYQPGRGMAEMFARLALRVFAAQGLIVLDASGPAAHRLGAQVLRQAIVRGAELHDALAQRSRELETAGYHAQVLVSGESSLLFLVREDGARLALKRGADGWRAGGHRYSEHELLQILDRQPERLSPSALLRPVFQDAILPTAEYIGGPAEVAYFAQTNVLYREILGRVTPIAPRLSASVVTPRVRRALAHDHLQVPDAWRREGDLALRLGARAMTPETKQRLAAAGNALDAALREMQAEASERDHALGHSADIAANKMRYQMNRLRRLMARYEQQRGPAIARRARLAGNSLYPDGHLQERVLAGIWALAEAGDALPEMMVAAAEGPCPGHRILTV